VKDGVSSHEIAVSKREDGKPSREDGILSGQKND